MSLKRINEFMLDPTFTGKVSDCITRLTNLEKPLTQADATGEPIRWDEFSSKHNNDGTFKIGIIDNADIKDGAINNIKINLTTVPTTTGKAIRWDEFSVVHNNDGTLKSTIIGNTEVKDNAAIVSSKLAIQKMFKKTSIIVPSATLDTYGTEVTLLPTTGYISIVPLMFDVVFGGTFGTETVTVDITVTYSDDLTSTITKTATAIGTVSLSNSDIFSLVKDNVYIKKMAFKSKSSIASTTATTTLNYYGFYL